MLVVQGYFVFVTVTRNKLHMVIVINSADINKHLYEHLLQVELLMDLAFGKTD